MSHATNLALAVDRSGVHFGVFLLGVCVVGRRFDLGRLRLGFVHDRIRGGSQLLLFVGDGGRQHHGSSVKRKFRLHMGTINETQ